MDPRHNLSVLRSRRVMTSLLEYLGPTGQVPEVIVAQLAAMSDGDDDDTDTDTDANSIDGLIPGPF